MPSLLRKGHNKKLCKNKIKNIVRTHNELMVTVDLPLPGPKRNVPAHWVTKGHLIALTQNYTAWNKDNSVYTRPKRSQRSDKHFISLSQLTQNFTSKWTEITAQTLQLIQSNNTVVKIIIKSNMILLEMILCYNTTLIHWQFFMHLANTICTFVHLKKKILDTSDLYMINKDAI